MVGFQAAWLYSCFCTWSLCPRCGSQHSEYIISFDHLILYTAYSYFKRRKPRNGMEWPYPRSHIHFISGGADIEHCLATFEQETPLIVLKSTPYAVARLIDSASGCASAIRARRMLRQHCCLSDMICFHCSTFFIAFAASLLLATPRSTFTSNIGKVKTDWGMFREK